MAYRSTITLRDADYEALERLKKALDMPTSQTIALAIRVADLIRDNQINQGGDAVLRSEIGKNLESFKLILSPQLRNNPTAHN